MKLPTFLPLPGFPSRPPRLRKRTNPLPPIAHKFMDALERIAGPKQILYMGPFQFIGDRKGGIYGQLELHFWPRGPKGAYVVHVGYIGVSPEHRRKGYASIMMNMLVQAADEVGMDMDLNISPNTKRGDKSKQMTERQLQKFYSKFGFKSGPGAAWKDMRRTR